MASLAELESRVFVLEQKLANAIPLDWVEVNRTGDLTGKYLYGVPTGARSGINEGRGIYGWKSMVANPTTDAHFESPKGPSN